MLISRMFSSLSSRLLNELFPPSVLPLLCLASPPSRPLGLNYDVTPQEALPIPHPIQAGSMLPCLGFPYLQHPPKTTLATWWGTLLPLLCLPLFPSTGLATPAGYRQV